MRRRLRRSQEEGKQVGWISTTDLFLVSSLIFVLFAGVGLIRNFDATTFLAKLQNLQSSLGETEEEIEKEFMSSAEGLSGFRKLSLEVEKIINSGTEGELKDSEMVEPAQDSKGPGSQRYQEGTDLNIETLFELLFDSEKGLETVVMKYASHNVAFTKQNEQFALRLELLRDYVEQLKSENEALKKKVKDLQERNKKLKGENDALTKRAEKLQRWVQSVEEMRQELLTQLRARLERQNIKVEVDLQRGVLRLPESLLFDTAEANLRPEGTAALSVLGEELVRILREDENGLNGLKLEAIFIEGHADNRKIKTREFQNNWELSTARAVNSYQALLSKASDLGAFKNRKNERVFSVSGYGEERPIADNSTEEGRSMNRRIDIRFEMEPPPLSLLEGLSK